MKDGRTHLAHKAEHAIDPKTGAIVGVTVQDADDGDTTTSIETLIEAAEQVEAVRPDGDGIKEVVGDKSYHSNQSLVDLEAVGVPSAIQASSTRRALKSWGAALPRRAGAGRPRPSGAGHALRSRKIGAAIPSGEFGLCDPRRSRVNTGNSSA